MLNIGVIGCGYWGPNLIRNLYNIKSVESITACDLNDSRLAFIKNNYSKVNITKDYKELISNALINTIVIATPVSSHYKFAKEALESGKHVFIEKPLTQSSEQAKELIKIAEAKNLVLMVGHTFEYTPAVKKIKDLIDNDELGEIYYISSQRLNLGIFQNDINVMWDLAPHDISIILYLLNGKMPNSVSASGSCHINPNIEDVTMLTLNFDKSLSCYIHSSWLDPNKIRKMTIVGSKKMLVYDDIESIEKIKIYHKGVDAPPYYSTFAEFQYSYRYGDIVIPMLRNEEPLKIELEDLCNCILENKRPQSDGYSGLRVVEILERAQKFLKNDKK